MVYEKLNDFKCAWCWKTIDQSAIAFCPKCKDLIHDKCWFRHTCNQHFFLKIMSACGMISLVAVPMLLTIYIAPIFMIFLIPVGFIYLFKIIFESSGFWLFAIFINSVSLPFHIKEMGWRFYMSLVGLILACYFYYDTKKEKCNVQFTRRKRISPTDKKI